MRDMILVLGSDVWSGRAVARRLRSEQFYCKLMPLATPAAVIRNEAPRGILLALGSEDACNFDVESLKLEIPMLALGQAARVLMSHLGTASDGESLPAGVMSIRYTPCALFAGVQAGERWVEQTAAVQMPPAFRAIATSQGHAVGYVHDETQCTLLQFLLERNDPDGLIILKNFAVSVCGCTPWWTEQNFVARAEAELRAQVQQGTALCAVSGGLDSTVAALLCTHAVGSQARCLLVDNGLLREGEAQQIEQTLTQTYGLDVTMVDRAEAVMERLKGVTRMEDKWLAVYSEMRQAAAMAVQGFPTPHTLVRGTNLTDTLRSGGLPSPSIEGFDSVVAPLSDLFKDEIRSIGQTLGVDASVLHRQPFPGMGLAARIDGEITEDRLATLRIADRLFQEEIIASGQEKRLSRYYATLYTLEGKHAIALHALTQGEGGHAVARLPMDVLERVRERVQNALTGVCQVVYNITPVAIGR